MAKISVLQTAFLFWFTCLLFMSIICQTVGDPGGSKVKLVHPLQAFVLRATDVSPIIFYGHKGRVHMEYRPIIPKFLYSVGVLGNEIMRGVGSTVSHAVHRAVATFPSHHGHNFGHGHGHGPNFYTYSSGHQQHHHDPSHKGHHHDHGHKGHHHDHGHKGHHHDHGHKGHHDHSHKGHHHNHDHSNSQGHSHDHSHSHDYSHGQGWPSHDNGYRRHSEYSNRRLSPIPYGHRQIFSPSYIRPRYFRPPFLLPRRPPPQPQQRMLEVISKAIAGA